MKYFSKVDIFHENCIQFLLYSRLKINLKLFYSSENAYRFALTFYYHKSDRDRYRAIDLYKRRVANERNGGRYKHIRYLNYLIDFPQILPLNYNTRRW